MKNAGKHAIVVGCLLLSPCLLTAADFGPPSVQRPALYSVTIADNPFSGSRFYVPNIQTKIPSIVILHGSEGGSAPSSITYREAEFLASQGYATLAYCYFDCNRPFNTYPQQTLRNVEVTRILDAVRWLRTQPNSNGKVAVYGFSRGAELTMLLGSLDLVAANRPDALVAHSPSDRVNSAWNWSWMDPFCWLCPPGHGACVKKSDYDWNPSCGPDNPRTIDNSVSSWLVSGRTIPAKTRIEIEKYNGPILITVGEEDEVWPVDQTKRIEETLKRAGRPLEVHYFPNEGHRFKGADAVIRQNLVLDFLKRVL